MAPQERIFFVGGTGNTGSPAVRQLLEKGIPVTLFARNPDKVQQLFSSFASSPLLSVVPGDLDNLAPLIDALPGHSRLFMVLVGHDTWKTKVAIAQAAYAAGIKQIVDVSAVLSLMGDWRTSSIIDNVYKAEKLIIEDPARPQDAAYVSLRPGRFMSNIVAPTSRPLQDYILRDIPAPDEAQGWISPNDIGSLAAVVLTEDIAKHGDAAYDMIGDSVTPNQRAAVYGRLLGRPITYQQITPSENFDRNYKPLLAFLPFRAALELATYVDPPRLSKVSNTLPILLGRQPESLEQYLTAKKDLFVKLYSA
ncbi:NAD(P)-binding protein [Hesseltinella vesiculosa]|uniref:NAD(P)-binding protein n=1 Tax=Hesseltinella vesiculosa TaxID=101127 RepID=A0A1X2GRC5_9FUNG|nr:NAD(P)-binding protein [Hesseltinella vesiculosa]